MIKHLAKWAVLFLAGAAPALSQGAEFDWKLSGFGTLGAARSDSSQADYLRDLSQPRGVNDSLDGRLDSRLGLQVQGGFGTNLRGTLQVVSKYGYDGTFKPQITWAFLGWNPTQNLQIRMGRLGFDVFMNADSRDVGYSFLWVRPPVEYYGTLPISHLDGLDASQDLSIGRAGTLRLKVYGGFASEKLPVQGGQPLDLAGSRLAGVAAEWQAGDWRSRLAYAHLRLRHNLTSQIPDLQAGLRQFGLALTDPRLPQAAEALNLQDRTVQYYSGGISYEPGNLQAQAAAARFHSTAALYPDSWSGFISCGYRFGKVVPFAYWSRLVTDRPTLDLGALPLVPSPSAQALLGGIQAALGGNVNDQSTWSAGLRWDFASQASFKFQVDRIRAQDSAGMWRRVQPGWDGRGTLVSAVVDFVF